MTSFTALSCSTFVSNINYLPLAYYSEMLKYEKSVPVHTKALTMVIVPIL